MFSLKHLSVINVQPTCIQGSSNSTATTAQSSSSSTPFTPSNSTATTQHSSSIFIPSSSTATNVQTSFNTGSSSIAQPSSTASNLQPPSNQQDCPSGQQCVTNICYTNTVVIQGANCQCISAQYNMVNMPDVTNCTDCQTRCANSNYLGNSCSTTSKAITGTATGISCGYTSTSAPTTPAPSIPTLIVQNTNNGKLIK